MRLPLHWGKKISYLFLKRTSLRQMAIILSGQAVSVFGIPMTAISIMFTNIFRHNFELFFKWTQWELYDIKIGFLDNLIKGRYATSFPFKVNSLSIGWRCFFFRQHLFYFCFARKWCYQREMLRVFAIQLIESLIRNDDGDAENNC